MNRKSKIESFIIHTMCVILIIVLVSLIILEIYCWIKYGNLPPEEVPSWVHWLMWRR